VKEVRRWLPEADLSNLRLHPAAHHTIEIEQPEGRTDKRGQFVLPVSPPEQNPDDLFGRAQSAEDAGMPRVTDGRGSASYINHNRHTYWKKGTRHDLDLGPHGRRALHRPGMLVVLSSISA